MELPQAFLKRMQALLGEEYGAYLALLEEPAFRGVRLNLLKCGFSVLEKSVPYQLTPSPFSPLCFYARGADKPGFLAAHHAGMFYSQEPSASSAVTALDPQPGEWVLDLCAAPGGKSTQIAGLLGGRGLLWSNEIVRSRAQVLLSNLERMGAVNAVVSACHPEKLCRELAGRFDRVLVDAPCSGEGMFRRDPAAAAQWTEESPAACAQRQLAILDSAALAVGEGGVLVYSTCTFSKEENEGVAAAFLKAHPMFEQAPIAAAFGRPALDGSPARRIFPMDGGEGHFVAKFRRLGGPEETGRVPGRFSRSDRRGGLALSEAAELYGGIFSDGFPAGEPVWQGEKLLLLPEGLPELQGLGVIRAGLELGERKGKRLEPSHALFMSRAGGACRQRMNFSPDAPALSRFFRGEEIDCPEAGYTAVCVNGVTAGFGKASGGRLKNRYPKGLRSF